MKMKSLEDLKSMAVEPASARGLLAEEAPPVLDAQPLAVE